MLLLPFLYFKFGQICTNQGFISLSFNLLCKKTSSLRIFFSKCQTIPLLHTERWIGGGRCGTFMMQGRHDDKWMQTQTWTDSHKKLQDKIKWFHNKYWPNALLYWCWCLTFFFFLPKTFPGLGFFSIKKVNKYRHHTLIKNFFLSLWTIQMEKDSLWMTLVSRSMSRSASPSMVVNFERSVPDGKRKFFLNKTTLPEKQCMLYFTSHSPLWLHFNSRVQIVCLYEQ